MEQNSFQLSRVYSQGWNAARKLLADGATVDETQVATLNPYRSLEQATRWAKGFREALEGGGAPAAKGNRLSWVRSKI